MLLKKIFNRLIFLIQLIAVVLFIIFEELIWETISKPIYDYIHDLHLLKNLQKKLKNINRYVILVLFLILLVSVEGAGLFAGVMAVKGMVLTAALLYGMKIPIAAFTFWLFHATESKLLSFEWFKWGYEKVVALFAWIKSREIYQETMEIMRGIKRSLRVFKDHYFSGENTIAKRFRRLYRLFKTVIKKER